MSETHNEQIARVRMMADCDGDTWDLSDNDTDALRAVLDDRLALLNACKAKLSDCRESGECSDAALLPGEYCSDECWALEIAIRNAEGAK